MKLKILLNIGIMLFASNVWAIANSPTPLLVKVLDIIKNRAKYEEYVLGSIPQKYRFSYEM